jgi:hypothetical protein
VEEFLFSYSDISLFVHPQRVGRYLAKTLRPKKKMFPNGDFDIKWGGGTSHPELNSGHDLSPLPPIGADIYPPKPRILSIFSSAASCPTVSRFIPKDHPMGTSKYTKGEIYISVTF